MYHGTCITHVPWCMSGSLNHSGRKTFPAQFAMLRIWPEAHWQQFFAGWVDYLVMNPMNKNAVWHLGHNWERKEIYKNIPVSRFGKTQLYRMVESALLYKMADVMFTVFCVVKHAILSLIPWRAWLQFATLDENIVVKFAKVISHFDQHVIWVLLTALYCIKM